MILLLGASGYIGKALAAGLERSGQDYRPLSRTDLDYTRFDQLLDCLKSLRPEFLINAAGFTGKPNVDACETARAETLLGNVTLPQTLSHACEVAGVPWGHVSSGCIYDGAWVRREGEWCLEKNLAQPDIMELAGTSPDSFRGFTEKEEPNFSFRNPPCSFYSGTKALAEEELLQDRQAYVWRLRNPFDEFDHPRNYLTKLQFYPKLFDSINSISHLGDFVRASLQLWKDRAPFGVYNLTNPGFITTRQVMDRVRRILRTTKDYEFCVDDKEFYSQAVKAPRSNCILEVSKLQKAGIKLPTAAEAVESALEQWRIAP